MDTDALLNTVSGLVWPDSPDLTCGESGHPAGHTCVPADDGVDLYGLADALDAFRAHWFESWNG
ncbi:hypothetical protein ABZ614_20010 [Streptomyces sp. NPDC013178]|uniref:hypothetical protein n=1 Tax=Streptomyces sp. NPDC013178 TaxID=3155118 RepID=UPI0033D810E4